MWGMATCCQLRLNITLEQPELQRQLESICKVHIRAGVVLESGLRAEDVSMYMFSQHCRKEHQPQDPKHIQWSQSSHCAFLYLGENASNDPL